MFWFSGCALFQNSEQKMQQEGIQQTPTPKKVVTRKKATAKKITKTSSTQNVDESADVAPKTSVIVAPNTIESKAEDEKYKVINRNR